MVKTAKKNTKNAKVIVTRVVSITLAALMVFSVLISVVMAGANY